MTDFAKVIRLGTVNIGSKQPVDLFCKIDFLNGRLSISGVEGPKRNGDCRGGCGQLDMHEWNFADYAPGWTPELVARFRDIWHRWHRNDMRAGSPVQEAFLKENPVKAVYPESHYDKASSALASAGLNPDAEGYRYGHAWKFEEVPADVIEFIHSLPNSDKVPAWV